MQLLAPDGREESAHGGRFQYDDGQGGQHDASKRGRERGVRRTIDHSRRLGDVRNVDKRDASKTGDLQVSGDALYVLRYMYCVICTIYIYIYTILTCLQLRCTCMTTQIKNCSLVTGQDCLLIADTTVPIQLCRYNCASMRMPSSNKNIVAQCAIPYYAHVVAHRDKVCELFVSFH